MSNKHVFSTTLAGRPLSVEIGELAKQANGAVLVRYGDTVVLSAAVASKKAGTGDFFPLTVHYIEKMYAVGKVPGGFIKRDYVQCSQKAFVMKSKLPTPFYQLTKTAPQKWPLC